MAKTVAMETKTSRTLIFLIDYLFLQLYMHVTGAVYLWFYFYGSRATSHERRKRGTCISSEYPLPAFFPDQKTPEQINQRQRSNSFKPFAVLSFYRAANYRCEPNQSEATVMVGQPQDLESPQGSAKSIISSRSRIVRAAHSPLGFFVLALLIVETFLLGSGTWFGLTEVWKITAICIGVFLFLVVFGTVVWLVIAYPQNLVFGEESHVQVAAMKMFGTESLIITGNDLNELPQVAAPEPPVGQLPNSTEGNQ
jgi:hypothetical protein